MKLTTQQIGRCGELFVQFKLLLYGIESAPLTTDTGVDLVAYSSENNKALKIQVKTNHKHKSGGGKGKMAIGWYIPDNSPADLFAFVDLETKNVWLVSTKEIESLAQQHASGKYNFFMYTDPTKSKRRDNKPDRVYEFAKYLLENRIKKIFF